MTASLESIVQSFNYAELPETWWVPDIYTFSESKKLYDYQRSAMEKAACALFKYYGGECDWADGELQQTNDRRKHLFFSSYLASQFSDIPKYERRNDKKYDKQNEVFRILSEYIEPNGDFISYHHLINRMCFWMATGSGKTLVMIKLIEYLHFLQRHKEIPNHRMLILAPSPHLLRQIRHTIDEFNQSRDLTINLIDLRKSDLQYQGQLGDMIPVYYHRSDNIADVQKEALTDYREYQNDGKWFIFLDEAHKGTKEDSKRQAYYAVMARAGFLFNFSATFTDKEDIATTVKKYNLEEFIKNGHGKNIYLNKSEYSAFRDRREEISSKERRKIVLKSLITLAYVSERVHKLRDDTGLGDNLYHSPLMLTLVNSVNTDIDREQNDLWTFFETLRDIATGEIDQGLFAEARAELIGDWQEAKLIFGADGKAIIGDSREAIKTMTISKLRKMVFLKSRKGTLQYVRSKDNKELAFQMKNADFPFALIRIGDTSKWRNRFLAGYEETTTLQETSFFESLEKKPITILMGSRSFFESWDSNRPNIINFINIGGTDAKKFVVQSVGRGVRIQPLSGKRRRLEQLLLSPDLEEGIKNKLEVCANEVMPIETLFLFATNRKAIIAVLEGLQTEEGASFELLEGFEPAPRPKISDADIEMPLLVPEYWEMTPDVEELPKFRMSKNTLKRFRQWFDQTSSSVLIVRDRLTAPQLSKLEAVIKQEDSIEINESKDYDQLFFLQKRLLSHIDEKVQETDGVRKIKEEEDIVHFRKICVEAAKARELQERINAVKAGRTLDENLHQLFEEFKKGVITREELRVKLAGQEKDEYDDFQNGKLHIKQISNHYYLPVVLGYERADYIKHIIKVKSEVEFIDRLEKWTATNNNGMWDAWMFSKVDESLDKIYIPYFSESNSHSRFFPDFIFWMCKGNKYQIVFVDPKGTAHTNAYHKIDGYKKLFGPIETPKSFSYLKKWEITTKLLMFNPERFPAEAYEKYWTDEIDKIFEG